MFRSVVLLLVVLLAGCSNPLPEDRLQYAGEWSSPRVYLLIQPNGRVDYERVKGSNTITVNAPIMEFVGDDFVVGVGFATTTFKVTEPPHQAQGRWQMVVDGERLTRTGGQML